MHLKTEIVEEKQKILIISEKKYQFIELLKKRLLQQSVKVYCTSKLPKNLSHFF